MYLNLILKWHGFVPFDANLTQFGPKSGITVIPAGKVNEEDSQWERHTYKDRQRVMELNRPGGGGKGTGFWEY